MKTVTSQDGTTIAFDQSGKGAAVILVDGALQYRAFDQGMAPLADLLSQHFTVIHYDRRGRGDSTDMLPDRLDSKSALQREIEDLEAIIDAVGGSAFLYGISSGAALAFEAALALGSKVRKLAMYEAPYNDNDTAQQAWKDYAQKLRELLAANRTGDAVGLFMMLVGASTEDVEGMRQHPMWPLWEAVAPTLAYDHIADLGEEAAVPIERATHLSMPALVMDGRESYPFMHETAVALAKAIPNARHCTLEGQTHEVAPEALAPALVEFFEV